jgi:GNAT superfamily N-acetyltransferase
LLQNVFSRSSPLHSERGAIAYLSVEGRRMTEIAVEQPSDADIDIIHAALTETYWSPGIPREIVARAFANSLAALAREGGALVGWARLVTDKATFAWLCDVWVAPSQRGGGLGRAMVGTLRAHPELQGLRRWLLGTRDAHGVYAALGFEPIAAPERLMEIRLGAPYGVAI